MSNDSVDLVLEDWKMTKDRIKHFDNVVIRLRLGGIPIANAIIGAGLASFQYTSGIALQLPNATINATSIIILLGAFYLIPVFALDVFHYRLLRISVDHAKQIELRKEYKGKLQITTKLTSPKLTLFHTGATILIYGVVFVMALWLAYAVNVI